MHLDDLTQTDTLGGRFSQPPQNITRGLVLMGGGARTAYQAGVLQALAALIKSPAGKADAFPFQVLVGTSAGALNATYLASRAIDGLAALSGLGAFWHGLHSHLVYHLPDTPMAQFSRWATALGVTLSARKQGAALDSMPLVDTLHRRISLDNIDLALTRGDLKALAVTASSYTTGVHWTFCQTHQLASAKAWNRPGRRAELQDITIEHLMASSAIPFFYFQPHHFGSTATWNTLAMAQCGKAHRYRLPCTWVPTKFWPLVLGNPNEAPWNYRVQAFRPAQPANTGPVLAILQDMRWPVCSTTPSWPMLNKSNA